MIWNNLSANLGKNFYENIYSRQNLSSIIFISKNLSSYVTYIRELESRSKTPDKKPPDNKLPRIIAKYAVGTNLFRLGSTNPWKTSDSRIFFLCFYARGLLSGGFFPGGFCLERWLLPRTRELRLWYISSLFDKF